MKERGKLRWLLFSVLLLAGLCAGLAWYGAGSQTVVAQPDEQYVVLAWNDLGMHCYNASFQELGVLPPWNTLWAQVVRIGDPPEIITQGIRLEFRIEDNTYSAGKTDFWETSPYAGVQNAQWLFDLSNPLPQNEGLTGTRLSGDMEVRGDFFIAEGIPLTEYRDSQPTVRYPYMLAEIVVYQEGTGQELARTRPVAPVSTEMHCDVCHYDNGPGNEGIATGVVERNILTKHDRENMDEYPAEYPGSLMSQRPVLCAKCHPSNALPDVQSVMDGPHMSEALHEKHAEEGVGSTLEACYYCHPGPQTQCLRGVMATKHGMVCSDCHGTLQQVAQNPNPWENEPTCSDTDCHDSGAYDQDQPLYRFSRGHGGIYCEACHDSTHAVAPSREPNDAIKFIGWQRYSGPLSRCSVCHDPWPTQPGPHGFFMGELRPYAYLPVILRDGP
ncbi:MAG: hypothetical protein ACK2UC_13230 [Anaerolineae bacterium]